MNNKKTKKRTTRSDDNILLRFFPGEMGGFKLGIFIVVVVLILLGS